MRLLILPLLVTIACAPVSSGQMGTGLPAGATGADVRVDEARPSVLTVPGASVEEVWHVLPAVFRALEIPGAVIDADALSYGNGRVTTPTVSGRSTRDLFRCGAGAGLTRGQYRIQFSITAQPRSTPSGDTELFIQTLAYGRLVDASRTGTTHCVSNGVLEEKLLEQVMTELGRGGD